VGKFAFELSQSPVQLIDTTNTYARQVISPSGADASILLRSAGVYIAVEEAQGTLVIARGNVVICVCICTAFATVGVRAAEPSAESFVEAIYVAYQGKNAKGVLLDNDAAVRRYFDPELAALIIKDRKDARGEVGKLDFDPFIDAQDWEIGAVDIAVREVAAGKASSTVSFKNVGAQHIVVLDLIKLRTGWRIADITWDRKATLRGVLTQK
jgi:hypothetical protein